MYARGAMRTGSLVSETIRPGSWTKVTANAHMAPTSRTQRLTGSAHADAGMHAASGRRVPSEEGNDDVVTRDVVVDRWEVRMAVGVPAVR